MKIKETGVIKGCVKVPEILLTKAVESKSESLGWWLVGEPKGQQ